MKPGDFIHSIGDAHIYVNHVEALREQLTRSPKPFPTIKINPIVMDIDKFDNDIYNVGGGTDISVSLKELTYLCENITGNKININSVPENRLADIPLYITDNTKINNLSGWKPVIQPAEILSDIFEWIKTNESSVKKLLS